jgi:hypothetical protein
LGFGHVTPYCPNKRIMVMKANNEVETDEEDEDEKMPPLEDVNDVCVENMIEADALVIKRALNMHVNIDIWKVKRRTYSTRDVMFIIRYVA